MEGGKGMKAKIRTGLGKVTEFAKTYFLQGLNIAT